MKIFFDTVILKTTTKNNEDETAFNGKTAKIYNFTNLKLLASRSLFAHLLEFCFVFCKEFYSLKLFGLFLFIYFFFRFSANIYC